MIAMESAAAVLAVLRGDVQRADALYERLAPAHGVIVGNLWSGDRVLGIVAHATRRYDQAAQHFEDAIVFCRKAGYRPGLAWSLCDYADLLAQRDAPGDSQTEAKLLEESLRISKKLGIKPLMERVLARRKILKA